MNKRILFLKILTTISFLLVTVSNEKISLFMGLLLLLTLFNSGIDGFLYSAVSLLATLYLFVSAIAKFDNKKHDILSLISISALYIPVWLTIPSSFRHSNIWVYITFTTFGVISILTFIQILNRLLKKTTR